MEHTHGPDVIYERTGLWDIANVLPLSHGTLPVAHGPVLSHIASVPWACCNGPWDISYGHPLSHRTLNVAHGPALSCVISVPWACYNGPWDIANVCLLSHGTLCVAHSPCITSLQWACNNGPWEIFSVHLCPMGHSVAHGPALSWITCVPWACTNGPWEIFNVHPLSHGDTFSCPWSSHFLYHICPMGVLQWTMGHCRLPMVLSVAASYLSHGNVVMDHGTL